MGKGQELYKKAKKLIPGGTMLLSKRPEMFLPENWPAYFSKAKGCEVWDLDGNHYYDMCLMGVGTNSLGYGREEVDEAVMNVIKNGNSATLNNPEEVELAERLCQLDPWAGMVRLCRTGGEANAVAIRIARAASGKDKVAVCGYHGQWYLGTLYALQAREYHAAVASAALSGCVLLDRRYLHRCRVGEPVLGTLLGMGPQRDLGIDYDARLCGAATLAVTEEQMSNDQ